jgi:hypothetical protein
MILIQDKLKELENAVVGGEKVIFFIAYEFEMRNQIIAQYAIENDYGLSHWTHMGFVQDVKIVEDDNGEPKIIPIPEAKVYDLHDAIKQVLPKVKEEKEIFIFEVMSYENITPEVLQLLDNNLEDLRNGNGVIILNVGTKQKESEIGLEQEVLNHDGVSELLAKDGVTHIFYGKPNLTEREDAIKELLKFHKDIVISEEVRNPDGTKETIEFDHDFENEAFMQKLAELTEGLTLTQVGMTLAYAMVANRGVVDEDLVALAVEDLMAVAQGADNVPKEYFMNRVLQMQDRQSGNYIVEDTFTGYTYRLLLEYTRSRFGILHFITGNKNGYAPLLEDVFELMKQAPDEFRYPVIKYNAVTEEVESIDYFERQKRNEGDEEQFAELKKIIQDNNGKVTPRQIMKWYRQTRDDDFILYMQGYRVKDKREQAAIQYIAEVDQISYKNLITTHESKSSSDDLITSGFAIFYID